MTSQKDPANPNAVFEYLQFAGKWYLVEQKNPYILVDDLSAIPQIIRYPLTSDQPAQIDCRITTCKFNEGAGRCSNISPAFTLHGGGHAGEFTCWSYEGPKTS